MDELSSEPGRGSDGTPDGDRSSNQTADPTTSAGGAVLVESPTDTDSDGVADPPEPPDGEVADGDGWSSWETWISWTVVGVASFGILLSLGVLEIFTDTTPTGGDMGAHVWGPRYLIDHLLPSFRLTGWTPDWYAGFPAYVFYMVVPSLAIVWLAVGPPWWLGIPLLAVLAVGVAQAWKRLEGHWARVFVAVGAVFIGVLLLPIPYNVAFKLVTVSGLVTLPIALYVFARAARVPFPGPPILALAAIPFIYDKGFTILGGNGASTMAGEFAFSVSLSLAFFFLAVMFNGVRTGRQRALGAALLALTILCHLIPAIFAGIVTFVLLWVRREDRTPWWDANTVGRVVAGVLVGITVLIAIPDGRIPIIGGLVDAIAPQWLFPAVASVVALVFFTSFQPAIASFWRTPKGATRGAGAGLVFVGAVIAGVALGVVQVSGWWLALLAVGVILVAFGGWDLRLVRWLLYVAPAGILITGFWSLPFLSSSTYMNDMGWEKYTRYSEHLLASPISEMSLSGMPYRNVVYALAALGVVLAMVHRVRLGYFLALTVLAFAWIFRFFPQYRLWNARLLPFFYLALYLLAALAVALVIRSVALAVAEWWRGGAAVRIVSSIGLVLVGLIVIVVTLGSFGWLPGAVATTEQGTNRSVNRWAGINFETTIVPGWAAWNYKGLEKKPAWPEYSSIISMMDDVGQEHGCGRAMWEYDKGMDRFGTPMALMLLPYFTDGCIGSMEGLYFEASSTTPFHFLNQAELSTQGSNAQRDLPYSAFNMSKGISHLQLMGVRYYLATTDAAIEAARAEPRLTELASETVTGTDSTAGTGSVEHNWVVFEVADSELVTPLENAPVVLTDADDHIDGWVYAAEHEVAPEGEPRIPKAAGPAVLWYNDPARWNVFLATSGPEDWPRAPSTDLDPPVVPQPPTAVSDVEVNNDSLSFRVDEVGTPILVKVSYFPNWKVSGAEGPFRVSPNFMVVVPTENEVTLSYGYRGTDVIGWLSTLIGLSMLVGLVWLDRRPGDESGDLDADPAGADGPPSGDTGESPAAQEPAPLEPEAAGVGEQPV